MPDAAHANELLAMAQLISLAGMGWLALSMPVHAQQVWGHDMSCARARVLRGLGAAALGVALLLCLRADHASMAVLVWVMTMTLSALVIAMTLAWRPRALRLFAPWARSVD